jgi:hypothetical protein
MGTVTPERVTVLELLASQAAISLENALLYADLQRENSEPVDGGCTGGFAMGKPGVQSCAGD